MPRPLLIRSNTHPYHITARCNNKNFFPLPMPQMWEIFLDQLNFTSKNYHIKIHAFVLMGNHFHLLCHTPDANIDKIMMLLMKRISDKVQSKAKTINHLWGGRYKWSLIQSQNYYYQVYKYIYQNPIRANIVSKVQDYPYSTLREEIPFPLHSSLPMGLAGKDGELHWLNNILNKDHSIYIRKGLRKGRFELNQKNQKVPDTF